MRDCESNETPVACENPFKQPLPDARQPGDELAALRSSYEEYVSYLNQIVDIILEQGVIPVFSTKADNGRRRLQPEPRHGAGGL